MGEPSDSCPKNQWGHHTLCGYSSCKHSSDALKHQIPKIEEVIYDMNQSTVFTKLDIKWAYHQLMIEEESRVMTTFTTHKGVFRYKRLLFGLKSASEHYQKVIQQEVLEGCEGAQNISDDIIVHGTDRAQHDEKLRKVLQRIPEKGLTLNKDKCQFRMTQLVFMGHVLSALGVSIEEAKVQAVKNARKPENAAEVRSFLGLVNVSAKFIPNLATISEPLRRLTRKSVPFSWQREHSEAFKNSKKR